MNAPRTVAALYVETSGAYSKLDGVDPWDEARDARTYAGPHPVVAHPPCQRWGRFWHGSTRKPHQYKLGDDGGCFEAALAAVKRWGGVLEHPAHSKAWDAFGLRKPVQGAGWWWCQQHDVWVCHVEQGRYGHDSRKPTLLPVPGEFDGMDACDQSRWRSVVRIAIEHTLAGERGMTPNAKVTGLSPKE